MVPRVSGLEKFHCNYFQYKNQCNCAKQGISHGLYTDNIWILPLRVLLPNTVCCTHVGGYNWNEFEVTIIIVNKTIIMHTIFSGI